MFQINGPCSGKLALFFSKAVSKKNSFILNNFTLMFTIKLFTKIKINQNSTKTKDAKV